MIIGFDNFVGWKNEEVNDNYIRISGLITWRVTQTGKSEIKVIEYVDDQIWTSSDLGMGSLG